MTIDLALSEEQEQLTASFGDLLAKEASVERVRAAEPLGFDPGLWDALGEVGATAMAVPTDAGGWGASLLDLALVAELAGRAAAPAPVIESQVAARLLAAVTTAPGTDAGAAAAATAQAALDAALGGTAVTTLALHPTRNGQARLVPAGAVADLAIVLDADRLALVPLAGVERAHVDNLGGLPLADLAVPPDAVAVASGAMAHALHASAVDEWLALTAAALVGLGARAQEMAVGYAIERHAWGVPIGTFQGVSHPLADSATALDGARLLARKAAWSAGADPARATELAAMAFAFASETSRDVTYRALHVHGGYGFMLEQDVQLYYRRARGWARVWGEPRRAYRRAAGHRYPRGR